jgi:signal transduction histidine kinase
MMQAETEKSNHYIFAESEMADRTRQYDWAATSLGPISSWPVSLLNTVNQILDSSFPMFIWWGPDFIQFYNDAYLQILGNDEKSKHPAALGQMGPVCFQEIWEVIHPLLSQVLSTGKPVYLEDQLMPIYRKGVLEQIYWTFSYNMIRTANGEAGGILVVCSETTNTMGCQQQIVKKQEEQRKNDFMSMVSHELKTPITSLSAYLQLLESKSKKTQDHFTTNAVHKSLSQVKKMTTMINGFLNISRLESGQIQIDRETFDMALLLREIEDEFLVTTNSHQIKVTTPCKHLLFADRDKISAVINNFITNAVKYSPAGTAVEVSCEIVKDVLQVSVSDQGAGISDIDKHQIFKRFYRSDTAAAGLVSGFGIGLYLCAEIIQHHQGQIWVEDNVSGKGSVFHFSLPVG